MPSARVADAPVSERVATWSHDPPGTPVRVPMGTPVMLSNASPDRRDLQRYLWEFDLRYSTCHITDTERVARLRGPLDTVPTPRQ